MHRNPITREIKHAVLDKCEWKCMMCNHVPINERVPETSQPLIKFIFSSPMQLISGNALVVDHIIAIKLGGIDDISNMQTLCVPCYIKKSTEEFRLKKLIPIVWQLFIRNDVEGMLKICGSS